MQADDDLDLATVAPAKVPEPPAKGKPNRGKPNPDALTGRESGSREPGHASEERLRAIAERAPEPPPPGPGRGKKKDAPLSGDGFLKRSGHTSEEQLRAIAERAPEPARDLATVAPAKVPEPPAKGKPGPGRGHKKTEPPLSGVSVSRASGHTSEEQLRAIAERAPEPVRDLADLRVVMADLETVLRARWPHLEAADRVRVAGLLEQVLRLVMRGRPLRVLRGGAAK